MTRDLHQPRTLVRMEAAGTASPISWRRRYAAALAEGNEMRDTITDDADRFTVRPEDGGTREEATELGDGN